MGESPTPEPLPPTPTVDPNRHSVSSPAGWSASWDPADWNPNPFVHDGLGMATLWFTSSTGVDGALTIETMDASYLTGIGYSAHDLTFRDTGECLPWFEADPAYNRFVAKGADGAPLKSVSVDRSWAVFEDYFSSAFHYIDCRMLVAGTSYVFIDAFALDRDAFNELTVQIQAVSDSVTIEGTVAPAATPTG